MPNEFIAREPDASALPEELLRAGDPLGWRIETYLNEAEWWTLRQDGRCLALLGCLRLGAEEAEVVNAAADPSCDSGEAPGVSPLIRLLEEVRAEAERSGIRRLTAYAGSWELGRLNDYQRAGFRLIAVEPDYYAATGLRTGSGGIPRRDRVMLEWLPPSAADSSPSRSGSHSSAEAREAERFGGAEIRRVELRDSRPLAAMKKRLDRETTSMLYESGERRLTEGEQLEQVRAMLRSANSLLLVAESGGEVVGYLEAMGGKVRRNQHTVYIVIGILEAYTGRGLGRRMFQEMFDWAARRHVLRAELTVQAPNQRAYRLYRSLGFQLEGIMRGALIVEGEPVDLYQMGCDLRIIRQRGVDK
ncbi:GNAT family N-acetyltransferase [Saccharibacillus sp. CPCC 101409]|uniref:GNAT family N-acetyltransferase n=1 Tax=Saccharibacillus sp. CPCC 101409 TaxID=3058041 RepID=UPI0026712912|nr:GNAT family N-acetyltransferase [Saccharibacillus sp. CPCC 101409]MDO3410626.1 GNAT family N-acetyltransferase [Saccharibacillus sp. CPCC 101409]